MHRITLALALALAPACSEPAKAPAPAKAPEAAKAPAEAPAPAKAPASIGAQTSDLPPAIRPTHPLCDAAEPQLVALHAGDSGAAIAYTGTPLQAWVVAGDAALGRKDDAAITASLADTSPAGHHHTKALIEAAIAQWMRGQLKKAAEGKDDRTGAWGAARCAWQVALRPLALDPAVEASEPGLAAAIDAAFAVPPDPAGFDAVALPRYETIEKSWFRVAHRRLLHAAGESKRTGDPAAAARARGVFEALRDRLKDRNTPGIAVVDAELAKSDPKTIDPDVVEREIAVALVKRARKYCDEAVDPAAGKTLGTPAAAATAAEGLAYTEILLPDMVEKLADQRFDRAAHVEAWQAYARAVQDADADEARRISGDLVQWNCAYQRALGLRECTSSADEAPRAPR